ncbi:hypothetical protein Bca4012_092348 [Brassica carinata]
MSLSIPCEYSTIDRSILIEFFVLDSQRRSLSIYRSDLDVGIFSDSLSGARNEAIDGVTGGVNRRGEASTVRGSVVSGNTSRKDVPCVTTTEKRIKLALMGNIPKVYPSYNEILRAQLGGESFSSMSASEGEDAEPAEEVVADGEDIEVTDPLVEKTDVPTADASMEGLTESAPGVSPSKKKKKKKKNKSFRKAMVDFEGGKDLAETDQVKGDRSTNKADAPDDLTERDPAGSFGVKRKEPTGGSFPCPGEGKCKRSCDRSPPSLKEIALPASRLLPWGGSSPPSDRFLSVSSERLTFCHDKDASVVNNPDACSVLVRRIQGGTHLMPVVPELAFPNGFIKSAQADMEAIVRKNQLILEQALRRMASDFSKAEAAIETKDAEIEKSKRDALSKSKEMIAERTRYYCERKQSAEKDERLEEELQIARGEIARLEVARVEEVEKAKMTLDRARGETPSSQPGFRDLRSDGHVGRLGDAEQDLTVSSLPRLEPLQEVEHLMASSGRNSFDRAKTTVSEGRAAKLSEGTKSAGATGAAVSDSVAEDQSP